MTGRRRRRGGTKRWLHEVAIIGSPDTVSARIAELKDELGFGNFMLVTGFLGNLRQDQVVATLKLFAKEVMPRFGRPKCSSSPPT
jgi:alkanesulfonate monooxygenase SsuD/methylene tetrahydromethanopterin reductase-like flavin-dependent oxidoreductase (luciferase family)